MVYWTVPYSKGYQASDKRQQAEYNQNAADYEARRKCERLTTVKSAVACYDYASKTSRERHRAEQDLDAQREMAQWAESMLYATLATFAAAIAGVVFLWRDTRQNMKIGQAQTRAYVNVLSVRIIIKNDGTEVKIDGTINNSGQSPARNLQISYGAAVEPPPFKDEWHGEADGNSSKGFLAGQAETPIELFLVGGDAAPEVAADFKKTFSEGYEVWFYGNIIYDDIFGKEQRSRFRFQIDKSKSPAQFFACNAGNDST